MKKYFLLIVLVLTGLVSMSQPITLACGKPIYHDIKIKSTTQNGTVIDTLYACDQDAYTVISWKIISGNTNYSAFGLKSISPLKCQLSLINKNAFKKYTKFALTIRGTDNGVPLLYNQHVFNIYVEYPSTGTAPPANSLTP